MCLQFLSVIFLAFKSSPSELAWFQFCTINIMLKKMQQSKCDFIVKKKKLLQNIGHYSLVFSTSCITAAHWKRIKCMKEYVCELSCILVVAVLLQLFIKQGPVSQSLSSSNYHRVELLSPSNYVDRQVYRLTGSKLNILHVCNWCI